MGASSSPAESIAAEPLARRVAAGVAKLSLALRHQAWKGAYGEGLTPTQGQILVALLLAGPSGTTPTALARRLAVTLATVSDAVEALQAKGLLTRLACPEDRRSVRLVLTPKGRQTARSAAGWADFLAACVERLPESDQVVLLRLLVHLIRELQVGGYIAVAGMCVSCRYFHPHAHPGSRRPHHCAFVDAPLGEGDMRLDCPDHEAAEPAQQQQLWEAWKGLAGQTA